MSAPSEPDLTKLLAAARTGTPEAANQLLEAVQRELRQLAGRKMAGERSDHTLQPTALVNEAYLRLQGNADNLEDRAQFFGAAAKAMERVLIDHARRRGAKKRGEGAGRVSLHDLEIATPCGELGLFEVREALAMLELESPELAALVRYRYYLGLTLAEIAELEGRSLATVKRHWTFARAWLYDRLEA